MQSCQSKNVLTGTGPIKAAKGSVSASNGKTENLSKSSISISSSSSTTSCGSSKINAPKVSCKIENILTSNVVIKPENDKLANQQQQQLQKKQNHNNGSGLAKPHENLYDYPLPLPSAYSLNLKVFEAPENNPARGPTGLSTVQHEAVQLTDKNNDANNHRKQSRSDKADNRQHHHHQITPLSIFQTSLVGKNKFSLFDNQILQHLLLLLY